MMGKVFQVTVAFDGDNFKHFLSSRMAFDRPPQVKSNSSLLTLIVLAVIFYDFLYKSAMSGTMHAAA